MPIPNATMNFINHKILSKTFSKVPFGRKSHAHHIFWKIPLFKNKITLMKIPLFINKQNK